MSSETVVILISNENQRSHLQNRHHEQGRNGNSERKKRALGRKLGETHGQRARDLSEPPGTDPYAGVVWDPGWPLGVSPGDAYRLLFPR